MKLQFYSFIFYCWLFCFPALVSAQPFYDCNSLLVSYNVNESRCTATGSISITASGGSGNYNYRVEGPVNTSFTSSNEINGLPPGTYKILVQDVVSGCSKEIAAVTVPGTYQDPAFTLQKTNLTCFNSNDGTISAQNLQYGLGPFTYSIITPSASGVGNSNSTGIFTNLSPGDYFIQLRDSCGGIQTRQISIYNYEWYAPAYTVTRVGCDSADVLISLSDNIGNTNIPPSVAFDGFSYGYIKAPGDTVWTGSREFRILLGTNRFVELVMKDRCGLIKSYTWNDSAVKPTVNAAVTISNKGCDFFRATVTGQQNLTNPQYCLYDNSNTLVRCNTSGVFDSIPFGSWCIEINDACYDTTFTRCFNVAENIPAIGSISGGNYTCSTFRATVTAQTNLTNAQFCIYDANNVLLNCNSTGVFDNLPYGSYCVVMQNDSLCYDTSITRCINIPFVIPSVAGSVSIGNRACSTFRATVTGQTNLTNPQYCIYDNNDSLIACNSTGVFDNLLYGSYCIRVVNDPACYDTTINRCFTVNPNKPAVAASVSIGNLTCSDFRASITGQSNLNNPQYCLYNSADSLLQCNTNGIFNNLAYGSYCIRIVNNPGCYDTTIVRCFTRNLSSSMTLNATAQITCDLGIAELRPVFTGGTQPYTVTVYYPDGTAAHTAGPQSSSSFTIQLPDLPAGLTYKIVGNDGCGNRDSLEVDPVSRSFTHHAAVTQKCPGSIWPNGYGEITADHTLSAGVLSTSIIKKNSSDVLINPNVYTPSQSLFSDLEPAVYVLRYNYTSSGCNRSVYDTVEVKPYSFPGLAQSAAYQCNNNSFSIGAAVQNGVAPFTYEIIGSVPASPSLTGMSQNNPVFTINNGTSYNLVRLRVTDGCFNATLNDVSILPLANTVVTASSNCYYNNVTLSVGSIPNATYTWYRKTSETDSTEIGTGLTYNVPFLLPSDTGVYVCVTSVNSGCLSRVSSFNLNAACGELLNESSVLLQGKKAADIIQLNWQKPAALTVNRFIIERSVNGSRFLPIGRSEVANTSASGRFLFSDGEAVSGDLQYRLLLQHTDGRISYSNTIHINKKEQKAIAVYPNPLVSRSAIRFTNNQNGNYKIEVFAINGQRVFNKQIWVTTGAVYFLDRKEFAAKGSYVLRITDTATHETTSTLLNVE
ncbi:MAG: T9SS type A sorting domain-containing protein [Lacibacter sp.]